MNDLFSYLKEKEENQEKVQLLLDEEPPRLVSGYIEIIANKELILYSLGKKQSVSFTSILGYPQGDL